MAGTGRTYLDPSLRSWLGHNLPDLPVLQLGQGDALAMLYARMVDIVVLVCTLPAEFRTPQANCATTTTA